MDEIDLDTNISNNLSIELEIDDSYEYWDGESNKTRISITVKLLYNGKVISSDYGSVIVG